MFDPGSDNEKMRMFDPGSDNELMNLRYFLFPVGEASCLVERMKERGGTPEEIERATKYYYVVFNGATEYYVNWRKSYDNLGIEELIKKYGVQKGEKDDQNVL